MNRKNVLSICREAHFPAIMASFSLLFFIGAYLFVTMTSVEPPYTAGLLFFLPFLCFGAVTFFTVKGKWKKNVTTALTIVLTAVLFFAMMVTFVVLSWNVATTVTSDVGKYQRVLQMSNYPRSMIEHFPAEIPQTAQNTVLSYHPAALQGGESFDLKFNADVKTIENYENEFLGKTEWSGKPDSTEAQKHGLLSSVFTSVGYDTLPDSFTVYLFHSKPYRVGDWNHGEVSLAAINKTRNEIIFHAERW